jgi:hypothetical protein
MVGLPRQSTTNGALKPKYPAILPGLFEMAVYCAKPPYLTKQNNRQMCIKSSFRMALHKNMKQITVWCSLVSEYCPVCGLVVIVVIIVDLWRMLIDIDPPTETFTLINLRPCWTYTTT